MCLCYCVFGVVNVCMLLRPLLWACVAKVGEKGNLEV
jgi:hypothetical protein